MEQAGWLNQIISQMWPYVGQFAQDMLKTQVEPLVNQDMPEVFQPFVFETIDFGTNPPIIKGVQVFSENVPQDKIIMDVHISFDCNGEIEVSVSGMEAGIRDLNIDGVMRIVMWPLIGGVPLIGGMNVFFLESPEIEFELNGLASVLDFPLLRSKLRDALKAQLSNIMVIPNKIPVCLSPNIDPFSVKFMMPTGVLRLFLIEAVDLKMSDVSILGKVKPDPYCRVILEKREVRTRVISSTTSPRWNRYFELISDQIHNQNLKIKVMDKDIGEDDHLGEASFSMEHIVNSASTQVGYPLENVSKGVLHLRADWLTLSSDPNELPKVLEDIAQLAVEPEPDQSTEGENGTIYGKLSSCILFVLIEAGTNLPLHGEEKGTAVAKLTVGSETRTVSEKEHEGTAVFGENFDFLLEDPSNMEVVVQVEDKGEDRSLGTVQVALADVLQTPDMQINQMYPLTEGPPGAMLKLRTTLRILVPGIPKPAPPASGENQEAKADA